MLQTIDMWRTPGHQVLGLDVAMADSLLVHVGQPQAMALAE